MDLNFYDIVSYVALAVISSNIIYVIYVLFEFDNKATLLRKKLTENEMPNGWTYERYLMSLFKIKISIIIAFATSVTAKIISYVHLLYF